MIPRTLFTSDHDEFRKNIRRFIDEECVPHHARWEEQQYVDRSLWNRAGELGFLCLTIPEEYGGMGGDRLYSTVLMEEQTYAGATGPGFAVHSDIVANYMLNFGTEDQKRHWLPKMAAGEAVGAIAMTEPGTGSDLQSIKTRAQLDGDDYVINGSKIFITNGYLSDVVIVAAKTGESGSGAKDISLILVENGTPGFTKAAPLKKVGMKAQDTCELFFQNVRVPRSNVLGGADGEGRGFIMLMKELAWERLIIAILSMAGAQAALNWTIDYTRSRKVFGKPVVDYQNSRFKLAEMKADIAVAQVFVDRCLELVLQGKLTPEAAAAAKLFTSDLVCRVVDECVQLHGGYGYMLEYPIARAFIDNRASRIYGGTNEIMKELIARTL
ncbi:alkylation response protein AidB-like acyl-CoA dehydrogenase [Povalibacter uvarum]|uniref:Acyl-[acyl-carrier-protein] dehydrogenase MbtN n=1 Tax=Povalibacter uvarum TaxID=732238 RepID=A0A841HSW6_9GAMM|nr:acyl-CoA dehydrogenase family protein [Povalibacter uvarum]MBB6095399.1 alkylation response protein AidB-like acyl-CoA dehydrogenase [Povalibacter uvarum]